MKGLTQMIVLGQWGHMVSEGLRVKQVKSSDAPVAPVAFSETSRQVLGMWLTD